ncbi:YqcC family protein [Candidatus Colwellia aromaticivorans]|uniref:YqcC family protein n=1 Tax=Candidatus Colwellia aromaticivorans TaxID=2267621 RepID=UPI001B3472A4|nr:YqcC family protein [Candidatus Colwellia aromaticivorans]
MRLSKEQQTSMLLVQLFQELKTLTLWQKRRPNLCEMASTLPFHYDTLAFEQWLQFVFIERISLMIEKNQPLPSEISLLPMAEESFKNLGNKANTLLNIIGQLDSLLSGRNI